MTAKLPESLLRQPHLETGSTSMITTGGAMDIDQQAGRTHEVKFSHEVKPSALTNSTSTADKILQRDKLMEAYASKEL